MPYLQFNYNNSIAGAPSPYGIRMIAPVSGQTFNIYGEYAEDNKIPRLWVWESDSNYRSKIDLTVEHV